MKVDDAQLVELQQDMDELVFRQLENRDDLVESPVIDDQIGDHEGMGISRQGLLLSLTELGQGGAVARLDQFGNRNAQRITDPIQPLQRKISPREIALDGGFADADQLAQ